MILFSIKNLGHIFREYKTIFAMFFFVFALVACSLLYIHIYNVGTLESGYASNSELRTYTIQGSVESGGEQEFLDRIQAAIPERALRSVLFRGYELVKWDNATANIVMSPGVNTYQIFLDRGGLVWTGNGAELILDNDFSQIHDLQCGINDVVMIQDIPFTVRAMGNVDAGGADIIVSPEGYRSLDIETVQIEVMFDKRLSERELQALEDVVGSAYRIIVPEKYNATFVRQFFNRFLLIGIMVLMATMNIMGLYRYIIMRRKKEFLIYRIYGISQGKLFGMIVTETLILSTVGFLLGAFLFLLLAHIAEGWIYGTVSVGMFIQTYAIEVLCALIAVLPIIRRLGKRGIYGEYGREEAR